MDEKLREALTDRGQQGSTVRRVTATAERTRRRSVRDAAAAAIGAWEAPNPNVQKGAMEAVPLKEEDHRVVAEERSQGTASALLELFRRLLQIAYRTYWVRELQQPRSLYSGPV